jgi:hypothetical protein
LFNLFLEFLAYLSRTGRAVIDTGQRDIRTLFLLDERNYGIVGFEQHDAPGIIKDYLDDRQDPWVPISQHADGELSPFDEFLHYSWLVISSNKMLDLAT